ncbi:MAG: sulfotransferase domain-containing protein [Woeseiaceae bacterium]
MFSKLASRLRSNNVTPGLVWIYVRKLAHQALSSRPERHSILAVLGCQRSGTSVMSRVFFRDLDVVVFREKSVLTGGAEGLRYLPFDELNAYLAKQRAPFIVFKMLVESQRARDFLNTVDGARVVWLFRNYRDIVNSNLTKFGIRNGIDDLRPIVNEEEDNWRSEACSEETRNTIRKYFSESMNPRDAAALFWYARNRLYFEQELFRDNRVMLMEYENFVRNPASTMRQMYELCDRPYPGDYLVAEVATGSISKGRNIDLSPEVDELCNNMLTRLQDAARNSDIS